MEIKITGFNKFEKKQYNITFSNVNIISTLTFCNIDLFHGNTKIISDYIMSTFGESVENNRKRLIRISPELNTIDFRFKSSFEFMLFRSFCVVFKSLNLEYFLNQHTLKFSDIFEPNHLINSVTVDPTGLLGQQPSIYFIDAALLKEKVKIDELVMLQLLFHIEVKSDEINFANYFIPFNLPITKVSEFQYSYDLWLKIKSDRENRMRTMFPE